MSDKMWELLEFLKNPGGSHSETATGSERSEDEKKAINDQLMTALEDTERAVDKVIAEEAPAVQEEPVPSDDVQETFDAEAFLAGRAAQTAEAVQPEQPLEELETEPSEDDAEDDAAPEETTGRSADEAAPDEAHSPHELVAPAVSAPEEEQGIDGGSGHFAKISVARIKPNPFQPRKMMGENEITELSQSIRELGVLQPILVRQIGDAYELIAGERRLRAAQRAGLTEIPAVIVETEPLNQQIIALVENIQRKNLSSIEEAVCLEDIIEKTGWTQTELSRRTGRSQASIANKLRLLRLDRSVQELIISGKLGERQARSLLSFSVEEQRALAQKAIDEDLSARALEMLAENWNGGKKSAARSSKSGKNSDKDGPAGALLADLASLINKHRSKGIPAQWKVRQMDRGSLVVEISVDLSSQQRLDEADA